MSSVRVRFAPSPTGYLHIGGLRTALYNFLLARRLGGSFILRIEDTDRSRFVADAETDLTAMMTWAGLSWDEGPDKGGAYGPYRQSERRDLYAEHAERLLAAGKAYLAFDSPEEIDAMRTLHKTPENPSPRYDAVTRTGMRNSLTLPEAELEQLKASGAPYVVRLRVDPGDTVSFTDSVRGDVTFATDEIDDQVLVKSDGMPTYHLANVVDDHLMAISHVIRGEEWLPSTPKHILLYDALGWTPPTMAHLPLILSPNGGKLSKRSAERLGIPVLVRDYVTAGYEAPALINYLALLGWNPGDEREVFSLGELEAAFSLDRVGSAGTQFDGDKLAWFNGQHIRRIAAEDLAARTASMFELSGRSVSSEQAADVVRLMHERVGFARELVTDTGYLFEDPETYDEKGVKKRWKDDSAELLRAYADRLEDGGVDAASAETALRELAEAHGVGAGRIIHPVRLAVSGITFGPSLFDMLAVIGSDAVVRRLRRAADTLG